MCVNVVVIYMYNALEFKISYHFIEFGISLILSDEKNILWDM